jgi:hypothetical protein
MISPAEPGDRRRDQLPRPAPPIPGVDPTRLSACVSWAARQARAYLDATPASIDPLLELVHLIAGRPQPLRYRDIAARAGISASTLTRLCLAYRYGGDEGVRNARHYHTPPPSIMDQAATSVHAAAGHRATNPDRCDNTLTYHATSVQIRLGHNAQWYPYARAVTDWMPAGPPDTDPVTAYHHALAAVARRRP